MSARSQRTKRPRDPELALARRAKKAGIGKAKYIELRSLAMRQSAAAQSWRISELSAALANIGQVASQVWGGA